MRESGTAERVALGAAAGFAGTLAMQGLRTTSERLLPDTMPPMRKDPGEFMVEQAERLLAPQTRERVPAALENAAGLGLAVCYGLTAGALYGALRPRDGSLFRDGAALGLGVWAAGYLGWMPALGLVPPITEQRPPQALGPMLRHVLFGIATVAAFRGLERLMDE